MVEAKHAKKSGTKRRILTVILVVLIAVVIGCVGYMVYLNHQIQQAEPETEATAPETTVPETTTESTEEKPAVVLPDNPIDFASLKETNGDVRAWISIPDTNVNYAVCQSTDDDYFYLDHDSDGDYSKPGAIYFEMANSTDLSDPVTVFYGHDGYGDTMFTTLHYFEDADFFNSHEYFYVYAPGHIYTYEIISAFMYDDRHILNSFDFSNVQQRQEYFDLISSPESLVENVREGVALTSDSKVITLSTCMEESSYSANRYLVSGVRISDELTN